MLRFFIPPERIGPDQAILKGPEARHARTVMRLGPGDALIVFDGTGREYQARITAMDNRQVLLDLVKALPGCQESLLRLTLAQGYLKDKKMDRLVRQLTELGVSRWVPFFARRSVALPDVRRQARRHQRWQQLSLEALKQCRRSLPMEIAKVVSFADMLALAQDHEHKWVFYENADRPADWAGLRLQKPTRVIILIGPEGGLDPDEIQAAREHGFQTLGLGPRILRAETAALAACAIAQAVCGDMQGGPPDSENSP